MKTKEIYLAGGCFWGTEHYFKQIAAGYCHLPQSLFEFARQAREKKQV